MATLTWGIHKIKARFMLDVKVYKVPVGVLGTQELALERHVKRVNLNVAKRKRSSDGFSFRICLEPDGY